MVSIYLDNVAEKSSWFSRWRISNSSRRSSLTAVDVNEDVDVTPMKAVNKCNKHMQQQ